MPFLPLPPRGGLPSRRSLPAPLQLRSDVRDRLTPRLEHPALGTGASRPGGAGVSGGAVRPGPELPSFRELVSRPGLAASSPRSQRAARPVPGLPSTSSLLGTAGQRSRFFPTSLATPCRPARAALASRALREEWDLVESFPPRPSILQCTHVGLTRRGSLLCGEQGRPGRGWRPLHRRNRGSFRR